MSDPIAIGARARGLTLHLFTRAELEQLAGHDAQGLSRALAGAGKLLVPPPERASAAELDYAVQQTAARHLGTLRRWGPDDAVLEAFEAAADLKSLRALVRGAAQGAHAAERARGLVPSRMLPVKLLEVLAHQPTAAGVAAHLFATGHPDGARLSALTKAKSAPELLALDRALLEGFAARAIASAKRGDDTLRRYVAFTLDASNLAAALALAGSGGEKLERWFVPGGAGLSREVFVQAASAPARARRRRRGHPGEGRAGGVRAPARGGPRGHAAPAGGLGLDAVLPALPRSHGTRPAPHRARALTRRAEGAAASRALHPVMILYSGSLLIGVPRIPPRGTHIRGRSPS